MPFGAVIALLDIVGCHHADDCCDWSSGRGCVHCTPWSAAGQYHIERNVRFVLPEPVPCRGALGLWRLPDDVEQAVLVQLDGSPATTVQEARNAR